MEPAPLRPHEWIAVSVLLGVIVLLAGLSFLDRGSRSTEIADWGRGITKPYITVEIEGAVAHPGIYQFPGGAELKDLLDKAQPLPDANLKGLRKGAKLKQGQVVTINEKSMLTIYLEGAMPSPLTLQVKEGTRVMDLIDKIVLDPRADLKWLNKKRKLKDQERLTIPFLKSTASNESN